MEGEKSWQNLIKRSGTRNGNGTAFIVAWTGKTTPFIVAFIVVSSNF
jgi:hypothetical protein